MIWMSLINIFRTTRWRTRTTFHKLYTRMKRFKIMKILCKNNSIRLPFSLNSRKARVFSSKNCKTRILICWINWLMNKRLVNNSEMTLSNLKTNSMISKWKQKTSNKNLKLRSLLQRKILMNVRRSSRKKLRTSKTSTKRTRGNNKVN